MFGVDVPNLILGIQILSNGQSRAGSVGSGFVSRCRFSALKHKGMQPDVWRRRTQSDSQDTDQACQTASQEQTLWCLDTCFIVVFLPYNIKHCTKMRRLRVRPNMINMTQFKSVVLGCCLGLILGVLV